MKLLIATKNPGKFEEIADVLGALPIKLLSLADLGLKDEVEEHGTTHEENAVLKAQYFFKKTKIPTLGEDSGIEIDFFPGELGVATRRWQGLEKVSDEEWLRVFLKKMKNVEEKKRGAKFISAAALIINQKSFTHPQIFYGETRGAITHAIEAPLKPGIPLSSCFRSEGFAKVYASLTPEEKTRISHRGKAMQKVAIFLNSLT